MGGSCSCCKDKSSTTRECNSDSGAVYEDPENPVFSIEEASPEALSNGTANPVFAEDEVSLDVPSNTPQTTPNGNRAGLFKRFLYL